MTDSPQHNEPDLFKRIAQGDGQAFTIIFNLYFERLRWNALKLLKSSFWAEEIVQEVFVQVWANRDRLTDVLDPSAYLFRIATNRCLDRIRREELEIKSQYLVNQVLHGEGDSFQENRFDFSLTERLMHEAVQLLPPQGKLIYDLQQREGLSYKQIAARLNISPHTVRNHMVKTLQSLRNYLQEKGDFPVLLFFLIFFKK